MMFGVDHHTTLIVNILFRTSIFPVIGKKNTCSLVSDVDREIPTRGSTDNAGNSVCRVSGIICLPSGLHQRPMIDSILSHFHQLYTTEM